MQESGHRILVAMSGGVDSSVAAALLKDQGHEVIGAFMRNGVKAGTVRGRGQGCCGVEDALDARRVAERLDIPFYSIDLEEAFEGLIGEFVDAYARGDTPNPCIECNRRFKMGALRHLARRLGSPAVATGHYARIVERSGRLAVERGHDGEKDQSYVLFSLDQDALRATRFPLGDLTKAQVRAVARERNLPVAEKAESMEICFVPTGDYRDVLRERRPEVFAKGPIVDQSGRVLGEHGGTALFTVGQRRGLPGGQGRPIFVTEVRPETNTVVVGREEDVRTTRFLVTDGVFTGAPEGPPGTEVTGAIKIRSHHEAVPATITFEGDGAFRVTSGVPLFAVTPGQSAVLYDGDRVLLGGRISREPSHCV